MRRERGRERRGEKGRVRRREGMKGRESDFAGVPDFVRDYLLTCRLPRTGHFTHRQIGTRNSVLGGLNASLLAE